jgi:hypothetical protein
VPGPPLPPADERRHDGAAAEEWTFSFWWPGGAGGGIVLLRLLEASRTAWYWTALVRAGEPLLHVTDFEAPLPRVGLSVRSDGLWTEHVCEAPFEQWTVANETYAVALDHPDDALGLAYGRAAPLAFDLEWYAGAPPVPMPGGYSQTGEVHGRIELGAGALELDGLDAHRTHRWGDHLDGLPLPDAMAHRGLRAPVRLPGGEVLDLVLAPDGWRRRVSPG